MTRFYRAVLAGLLIGAVFSPKAFAVWPPATSLQEEAGPTSRQDLPLADRLDEDVHRLDEAVRYLKEDQQELKQAQEKTKNDSAPGTAVKEGDRDGHSLR